MTPTQARSRAGLLAGVGMAALLLAPLVGRGFVLVQDMVFVPRMPFGGRLLGLDGVPRAVPSDLLVALASRVLPADWLQDVILIAIVVGAAWGAARLVPSTSRAAAMVGATAYGWSAFLHERLLLGQWALLIGWAVLPWAARAALDWRRGGSGWPAVLCLAVASCGGASSEVLVALLVVICGRPARALLAAGVLSLPWAVPALLLPSGVPGGDPAGVAAFASRADTPYGVVVSLLTGGGIWAPAAVPPGRSASSAAALVVLVLAALGLRQTVQRLGRPLLVAAGAGLLLALLGRLPLLADLLRWAVQHVPATGLLRDGQKWVAPTALLVALAAACGAEALVGRLPTTGVRRLGWALTVLAPLAALPGAAWAEGGRLQVSHYPADWAAVTARVHGGTVLVLPWGAYRRFPWTGDRTVLDPAPRWLSARGLVDDDLPLRGVTVRGEDPLARRLAAAASSDRPLLAALRADGVGQVLVERTAAGARAEVLQHQVEGLALVVETPELALYQLPGGGREPARPSPVPALLGDTAAAVLALSTAVAVTAGRRRRSLA